VGPVLIRDSVRSRVRISVSDDAALTNRTELDEVLFGVKQNDTQAFTVEKLHLGTKLCDRKRTIDRERPTLFPECDGTHPKGTNQS
jgi:hypothetical protein